jgi:hypothetical protein
MKEKKYIYLLLLFLSASLLSCGKVTQVIKEKEEAPSFDMTYSIKVLSKDAIKEKQDADSHFSLNNYFSVLNDHVYSQVLGIKKTGSRDELSWGRAVLMEDDESNQVKQQAKAAVSTGDANVQIRQSQKTRKKYISKAYRKDNIEMMKSDYTWTKLSFDSNKNTWKVDSKKIRKGYPVYVVKVFSDKNKYYMRIVDEKIVSENKKVSLDEIAAYETFVAVLFLTDLDNSKGSLIDSVSYFDIFQVYDHSFFNAIDYVLPRNKVKKFKAKTPVFIFERKLEKELLKLLKFVRAGDIEESKRYVNDNMNSILSQKARQILLKNIEAYEGNSG